MAVNLKRTYFAILLPAVFGFITVLGLRYFNLLAPAPYRYFPVSAPLIFILCSVFSLALPIFYRTLFAHKMRRQINTPIKLWLKFERNLIVIALVGPYLALVAHVVGVPRFYLASTVLMGLYAAYFFYPTQKRVAYEKRIFRVQLL